MYPRRGFKQRHNSAVKGDLMKRAVSEETRKALAAALRENLKRRKAQARGRKAAQETIADVEPVEDAASQAGAPQPPDPRTT